MAQSKSLQSPVFIGLTTATLLIAGLGGVLFGLGTFTFGYAEGLS